jgi:hypothetical protein
LATVRRTGGDKPLDQLVARFDLRAHDPDAFGEYAERGRHAQDPFGLCLVKVDRDRTRLFPQRGQVRFDDEELAGLSSSIHGIENDERIVAIHELLDETDPRDAALPKTHRSPAS